jgi:outer membrane protein TolC
MFRHVGWREDCLSPIRGLPYLEQVKLLTMQVKSGLASTIVLNQAQAQLQATLAQQNDVARARSDQEHPRSSLRTARTSFTVPPQPLHDSTPPPVPPGVPAALLLRRPDVAEAEQNIVAANAQAINQQMSASIHLLKAPGGGWQERS